MMPSEALDDTVENATARRDTDRTMARRAIAGLGTYVVASGILSFGSPLYEESPHLALGFVGFTSAVSLIRAPVVLGFDRFYEKNPRRWQRLFILSTVAAAGAWSAHATSTIALHGLGWASLFALIISAAIAAIGMTVYSLSKATFAAFAVTLYVPHMAVLPTIGGNEGLALAVAFTTYASYLFVLSRTFHQQHWSGLRTAMRLEQNMLQLNAARLAAEEASRAKSDFVSRMSHEVRTPLNGIIGTTSMLLARDLDSETREQIEVIESSSEALMELVNDVLDFAKIEAAHLELAPTDFDLDELVTQRGKMFFAIANHASIELRIERAPDEPIGSVVADPQRIAQVLTNLVGNAIKFTTEGEVVVRYGRSLRADAGGQAVRFEVQDTGIGIATQKLEAIFEEFTQADNTIARHHGGTGLGLAISKHLVELMGGEISVHSELGSGSTFDFWIPVEPGPDPVGTGLEAIDTGPQPAEDRAGNVLLVDDDPVNRAVIGRMLKSLGIEHVAVVNGEEALEHLQREEAFDLVLMDCEMPVMDGFTATQRIRANEGALRDLPVVGLSANAAVEARERALSMGMTDYLTKPFRLEELRRLTQMYLVS